MEVTIYFANVSSDGCLLQPRLISTIPDDCETHLQKRTKNVDEFENMEWNKKFFIEENCTCMAHKFNNKFDIGPKTCPVTIHILAKTFDDTDLAAHVMRIAEQAGLTKLFAKAPERSLRRRSGYRMLHHPDHQEEN